jgi:hypothetical protein
LLTKIELALSLLLWHTEFVETKHSPIGQTQENIMYDEMTSKELYTQLEAAGWSFGSEIDETTGISWNAYRRLIGGIVSKATGDSPILVIKPYSLAFPGSVLRSVNFEVRGQIASGQWVEFKVYGVRFEETLTSVERCTEVLLTAWNAVAGL